MEEYLKTHCVYWAIRAEQQKTEGAWLSLGHTAKDAARWARYGIRPDPAKL
jgi:hypothetical protein